jgi:hypothetical protein
MECDQAIRRMDKGFLFQLLEAQHESSVPKDFNKLIYGAKARMEPKDVKLVLQEFEEWKSNL